MCLSLVHKGVTVQFELAAFVTIFCLAIAPPQILLALIRVSLVLFALGIN